MDLRLFCVMVVLLTVARTNDEQAWSEQAHSDVPHSLYCRDSNHIFLNHDDKLVWTKHGHEEPIVTDDHYELKSMNGTENAELHIKEVTSAMAGIYFCHIYDFKDNFVGRVFKGLNIAGAKHDDLLDKYRSNIITGVVAGAAVCVFIISVCAIDRLRYLTDDQKRKRRDQKEERLRRLQRHKDNGVDNLGMDNGAPEDEHKKNYNSYDNIANTHL